jgi:surface antigen
MEVSMRKALLVAAAASVPLLGACQTNEQTGGLLGGLGGAAGGALIGGAISHNAGGALLGGAIGGLGGYLIGSAIGRSLDERDRQLANQAVMQVLYAPAPEPYYAEPEPYEAAPGVPPPRRRRHAHPRHETAHWASDHSGARGSATVVAVQQTGGTECKVVRQVAYVSGRELTENQRYCRTPNSEWQKA